jgi:hypothetical protein
MKEAMEILGMPAGPVRPPLTNCLPDEIKLIRELMNVYADWTPAGALKSKVDLGSAVPASSQAR